MKRDSQLFEQSYFEGWFKRAVGDFTPSDLELSRRWFWAWLTKLNTYIPIEKGNGRKVLEIGCSIGGVSSLLKDRGFDVYASDISTYAVSRAKKLLPNIHFSIFDVQKGIPIPQKFDVIIAFEVVEHLKKPEVAIRHMYRKLHNNGILVLSTPYPYSWIYSDPTHINVHYPHEWIAFLKKSGFVHTEYHQFSLMPYFYRLNKHFQIIFPFPIPHRLINNPIFFIGRK